MELGYNNQVVGFPVILKLKIGAHGMELGCNNQVVGFPVILKLKIGAPRHGVRV